MLTKDDIKQILRQNHPYLTSEYGVKKIGFFGSYAQGVPTAESDVDIVVEFDRPIGFRFVEFTEYLETLLDKKVDVLTTTGVQTIRVGHIAQDIEEGTIYV